MSEIKERGEWADLCPACRGYFEYEPEGKDACWGCREYEERLHPCYNCRREVPLAAIEQWRGYDVCGPCADLAQLPWHMR